MSVARRLLDRAEASGVRVYMRDGAVRVAYQGEPPRDFIAELRSAKSEIERELALLADPRAHVEALLADMAAENERRREWWTRPPEGWADGRITLRSALTSEIEIIDLRKRRGH